MLLKRIAEVDTTDGDGNQCAPYLRAICQFLLQKQKGYVLDALNDRTLAASDRIAIACKFLDRKALQDYLERLLRTCFEGGCNLKGLIISDLSKRGFALMQAYVDSSIDIQTAALVTSHVHPIPRQWNKREHSLCARWLNNYRNLLNLPDMPYTIFKWDV